MTLSLTIHRCGFDLYLGSLKLEVSTLPWLRLQIPYVGCWLYSEISDGWVFDPWSSLSAADPG